jgi:hypothetical protein
VGFDFTANQVYLLSGIVICQVNNGSEGIWKEAVVAKFKVFSHLLLGWTERKTET